MTAKEKQTIIIKTFLKPLLKAHGYSTKGQTWWRDQGDFFIIINLQNFSFNTKDDVYFCFNIGIALKNKMKNPENNSPGHRDLSVPLRHNAYISESRVNRFRNNFGYVLSSKTNVDDFIEEFKIDFEKEILPTLDRLKTTADCINFYEKFPFLNDYLRRIINES